MWNNFTIAPLPRFRDLFFAFVKNKKSDSHLALPWLKAREKSVWFSQSAFSLKVISAYRMAAKQKNIIVWVPEFFCNSSLGLLREIGVDLFFYRLNDNLEPDINWCEQYVDKRCPDIFILVHYFGQVTLTDKAVEFCKTTGAFLVEDGAHVLHPVTGIGDSGDFVLYSPHKCLSIPDGALLILRTDGPSKLQWDNVLDNIVKQEVLKSSSSFKGSIFWLIKRTLQKLGIRPTLQKKQIWPENVESNYKFLPSRMSNLSKRILSIQINSLGEVGDMRMNNLAVWNKLLNLTDTELHIPQMQSAPYMACIIGNNLEATKKMFEHLQEKGLPLLTWPDLSPEILSSPDKYNQAINLRQRRFYLPVHQSLNFSNFKYKV